MNNTNIYKNILILIVGGTPQIVTETMYKLMVDCNEPYEISEIHIITTAHGKERCDEMLQNYGSGAYYRFCQDFKFQPSEIKFQVHVIIDHIVAELNDIRDVKANEAAANYISDFMRKQAKREDVRILASLAGGRKTMSAYMGFAMQLYGRPQDKLFHVLVQPEQLENNPAFFYPDPYKSGMTFLDRRKQPFSISVSEIRVDLAEIPFVRLRDLMPPDLQDDSLDFTDVVKTTQKMIDDAEYIPFITVDLENKYVHIRAKNRQFSLKLSPREMAMYYFLCQKGELTNDPKKEKKTAVAILRIYEMCYPVKRKKEMFYGENLQQIRSRINQKIRKQISRLIIQNALLVNTDKNKYSPKYSLRIPPENITLSPS